MSIAVVDGIRWLYVLGGDDEGLLAAARLFAGVLPHTRTLSSAHLDRVRDDLTDALDAGDVGGATVRIHQARARSGQEGISRLVVDVANVDPGSAAEALEWLTTADGVLEDDGTDDDSAESDESDDGEENADTTSATLRYAGLTSVEVRLMGGDVLRLPGRAEADRPGPISGRPGSGGKDEMDLSNVYTSSGLLGGGPIPDRIDAMLVPGGAGNEALPDLAARLGVESTGLVVPLSAPASSVESPSSRPTMVLSGAGNEHTAALAEREKIDTDELEPGTGLIEIVPEAFGSKPALVVTGSEEAGATRALEQLSVTFPHLDARGKDRPTIDDVERELWDALSGHAPVGQAAIGMYKLDRLAARLADEEITSASVLMSVEHADPGLEAYVASRAAAALGISDVAVEIDDRNVLNAAPILSESVRFPAEVDRFWALFREQVLPRARGAVVVEARLSEPPEIRWEIEREAMRALVEAGADESRSQVRVLSAFKQGYSWLYDVVRPAIEGEDLGEIVIHFRRNDPPESWPQQAIHTPVRWLHEIFPIDEILERELDIDRERIRFEQTEDGPTYQVRVTDSGGRELYADSFDPKWVMRPYIDRFQDYEHVRVTTGWLHAESNGATIVDERIQTDPEAFWDYYQATVLPALYDHVMDVHDGLPRGASADAPYFGELIVDLEMSEPDYRLGIDNEIHAPMDALHEEIYFGAIEFFDILGRNSRGLGIQFPGRVLPIMRPKSDGSGAVAEVRVTGFATSRPAVVIDYTRADGTTGRARLDIPKTTLERPSARRALVKVDQPGLDHLALRVRVDTEMDMRDSLITTARELSVDERMVSAEQVTASIREIELLRASGLYPDALAFPGLGRIEVWAEWGHQQDPEHRMTASLAPNGSADALPSWRAFLPEGWAPSEERIVQWDTPIHPDEANEMMARMAVSHPEVIMYQVGRSYLGREIWAMDLMPTIESSHWSEVKATTFKPTVLISGRQHANEVSSTSHMLRHAELLLTDPDQRTRLDRVNVVLHPVMNPDGAQTAYDLYRLTPDYILHAGYLGPLGQDATAGSGADHPIYPESAVRGRMWDTWLPDIFLNPHGYPSHQLVQLFSEFQGLVRRGRVTERNWGFNKGWFMPGFGYVDSPDFPRHKDAAFQIRDYITRGINSNPDVFEMNQRAYDRYRRYGAEWDDDVFNLPMTDSVLIEMPLKGSSGQGGGFNPRVTIWSGLTEAPDETAYGPWMELVASAGLSWDQALTDYLADGAHEVKRTGSRFFGGVSLRMNRPRPPEAPEGENDLSAEDTSDAGSGDAPRGR
ncbi:MAG: M14 family metallopeptidase [Gemmatimonadota bacterium]